MLPPSFMDQWVWAVMALATLFLIAMVPSGMYHGTDETGTPFNAALLGYMVTASTMAIVLWNVDASSGEKVDNTTLLFLANTLVWLVHGKVTMHHIKGVLGLSCTPLRRMDYCCNTIKIGTLVGVASVLVMDIGAAAALLIPQCIAFGTIFIVRADGTTANGMGLTKAILFMDALVPMFVRIVFGLADSNDIAAQFFFAALVRVVISLVLSCQTWVKTNRGRATGNTSSRPSSQDAGVPIGIA